MNLSKASTNFRIDEKIYKKTKLIALREKRSINSQMEYFILKGVEEYERRHGAIDLNDEQSL